MSMNRVISLRNPCRAAPRSSNGIEYFGSWISCEVSGEQHHSNMPSSSKLWSWGPGVRRALRWSWTQHMHQSHGAQPSFQLHYCCWCKGAGCCDRCNAQVVKTRLLRVGFAKPAARRDLAKRLSHHRANRQQPAAGKARLMPGAHPQVPIHTNPGGPAAVLVLARSADIFFGQIMGGEGERGVQPPFIITSTRLMECIPTCAGSRGSA